jgi:hypothetical protein
MQSRIELEVEKELVGQHALFEESEVMKKGHKYEVQRKKGIGRLGNERGKGGPLPVLLDWTFLERVSIYFSLLSFPSSHAKLSLSFLFSFPKYPLSLFLITFLFCPL